MNKNKKQKENMQIKNDFAKGVLHKIKSEHIEVLPKWHFVVKELLLWVFVVAFIIVGALSTSVVLLHLLNIDIAIAVRANGGLVQHIATFVPYIWLLMLAVFMVLTWLNFKNTKKGYKYSYIVVVLSSVVVSIVLGSVMYFGGLADRAEHYAGKWSGDWYKTIEDRKEQMWTQPEKGLLAGVQIGDFIDGDVLIPENFALTDFNGKTWQINTSRLDKEILAVLAVSPKIAIVGIKKSEDIFEACAIVPWSKRGERGKMKREIMRFTEDEDINKRMNERNIFDLRNNICEN